MPLWRRLLKVFAALAATAVISYYFGRTGVIIGLGIAALTVIAPAVAVTLRCNEYEHDGERRNV